MSSGVLTEKDRRLAENKYKEVSIGIVGISRDWVYLKPSDIFMTERNEIQLIASCIYFLNVRVIRNDRVGKVYVDLLGAGQVLLLGSPIHAIIAV